VCSSFRLCRQHSSHSAMQMSSVQGQRLGGRATVPSSITKQISRRATAVVRSQQRKRPEYIPNR
jgi:hypothetical protein